MKKRWSKIDAEIYLENNPNATLQDYIDYFWEEKDKKDKQREQEEIDRIAFYEELIGKYYKFEFNGNSRMYVYIDRNLLKPKNDNHSYRTYNIYNGKSTYSSNDEDFVKIEYRNLNPLWFKKDCKKLTEVSKEKFNEVTSYIEEVFNKVKEF